MTLIEGTFGHDRLEGTEDGDVILGLYGKDILNGNGGDDLLLPDEELTSLNFDEGGYFTSISYRDVVRGGDGNDTIVSGLGNDGLDGGAGDDHIISLSDTDLSYYEPDVEVGQGIADLSFDVDTINPYGMVGDDAITGGTGADIFEFRSLIGARKEIIERNLNADGTVNWGMGGVAGENGNFGDHWVTGIGPNRIFDFSGAGGEGDTLVISGHTVAYTVLRSRPLSTLIGVYSDQGGDGVRGGGAHDMTALGTINVVHKNGPFDISTDVIVDQQDYGVFDGVYIG